MVRLLRSIPQYMYLGGEFPGLFEAMEELGLKCARGHITFLLGRAIAHWNIESKPGIHSQSPPFCRRDRAAGREVGQP
jgi:hypothetical protein